ncbi:S1 family peptidase [Streptomyces sp. NPDC005805]|uniref:S1 family peptidase n=1 Tax=Streptomyces sp. NPDC005805 TaxID=3157068 RepID=UPI0033ECD4A8
MSRIRPLSSTVAVVSSLVLAASAFTAGTAAAAPPADEPRPADSAATAYARMAGIPAAEAGRRLAVQDGLLKTADRLADRLGDRAGGAWLDQESGRLHVRVHDAAAADAVRGAGAVAHLASADDRRLQDLKRRLDTASRATSPAGVSRWYVDTAASRLVVVAAKGADGLVRGAFADAVRGAGDLVRVERDASALTDAAENLYAGTEMYNVNATFCSTGFNVRGPRNAAGVYPQYTLTAGHCMQGASNSQWFRNGVYLGQVTAYTVVGSDHAILANASPAYWIPRPAVWRYDGYINNVTGWSNAVVGSVVCKSGRTTGYSCGSVTAVGVSANTPSGAKWGQVQTNLCAEPGDSGGPVTAGNRAVGLTGSSVTHGASRKCGQKVNQPNVALFQPVGAALSAYGVSLVTG